MKKLIIFIILVLLIILALLSLTMIPASWAQGNPFPAIRDLQERVMGIHGESLIEDDKSRLIATVFQQIRVNVFEK
jgi:hypothetical protein